MDIESRRDGAPEPHGGANRTPPQRRTIGMGAVGWVMIAVAVLLWGFGFFFYDTAIPAPGFSDALSGYTLEGRVTSLHRLQVQANILGTAYTLFIGGILLTGFGKIAAKREQRRPEA